MSAVPSEIGRPSLKAGQALLIGRVAEVRRTENAVYTIINTPAPDSFSHPGSHLVTSKRLIGKPDEDVRVTVQLKGYNRSYRNAHGETVRTVDNQLQAVEE